MGGKYIQMRLMNKLCASSNKRANSFRTCTEEEDQEELPKSLSLGPT